MTNYLPLFRVVIARLLTTICLWLLLGHTAWALDASTAPEDPLTVPEICEKLKAGTTSEDLFTALTSRHLLEKPTAAEEQTLRTAGANPHLLDAIKGGSYTLSPFDASSARKRLAAAQAPGAGGAPAATSHMAALLRGKLVTCQNGAVKNYDDSKLAGKKYFALYYSASWCGPCREFTPKLVQYYQQQLATHHPEVEVILICDDESAADMQKYMQLDRMPWPALRFERKAMERELTHYAGNGIPDLVLVDGNGKVLSDSYQGKTYVGPYKVGNDLGKLIGAPQTFN